MISIIKLTESMQGKIPDKYDMKFGQLVEVLHEYKNNPFDMIYCAFVFGYLQGTRREKDEK